MKAGLPMAQSHEKAFVSWERTERESERVCVIEKEEVCMFEEGDQYKQEMEVKVRWLKEERENGGERSCMKIMVSFS